MRRLLAVLLALSTLADAAPLSPDPTGLWWVPQESGWGLSLTQQGETVVAVLFVYDDAQRPAWYVAATSDTGVRFDPNVGPIFSGTLYRTSGPWFGATFDPRAVTATPVGTLGLYELNGNVTVSYSINGVSVTKSLVQQTFASNVPVLQGSYAGGFTFPALPASGCNLATDLFRQPTTFNVATSASFLPGELTMTWGTGIDTACTIHGPYVQRGRLGSLDGFLSCQPIGFPLSTNVQITLTNIAANENGFNARAFLRASGCAYDGRFGGVRLP